MNNYLKKHNKRSLQQMENHFRLAGGCKVKPLKCTALAMI